MSFQVHDNPLWQDSVPTPLRQYAGLKSFTKAELKQHLPIRMAENTKKEKMIFAFLLDKYVIAKRAEPSFHYWTVGSLRTYVTSALSMSSREISQHFNEDLKKPDWIHLAMLVDLHQPSVGPSKHVSEIEQLRQFLETNFRKCR